MIHLPQINAVNVPTLVQQIKFKTQIVMVVVVLVYTQVLRVIFVKLVNGERLWATAIIVAVLTRTSPEHFATLANLRLVPLLTVFLLTQVNRVHNVFAQTNGAEIFAPSVQLTVTVMALQIQIVLVVHVVILV